MRHLNQMEAVGRLHRAAPGAGRRGEHGVREVGAEQAGDGRLVDVVIAVVEQHRIALDGGAGGRHPNQRRGRVRLGMRAALQG